MQVLLLSFYFAFSVFAAVVLSGPENQFWYLSLAAQYAVLLADQAFPKWPLVGRDGIAKILLGIIVLAASGPVVAGALGAEVPGGVHAFWLSISVPILFVQHFMRAQNEEVATSIIHGIPLVVLATTYGVFNPVLTLQS